MDQGVGPKLESALSRFDVTLPVSLPAAGNTRRCFYRSVAEDSGKQVPRLNGFLPVLDGTGFGTSSLRSQISRRFEMDCVR